MITLMILKFTNRPQELQASQDRKDVLWTWFMKAVLYYEHSNVLLKIKKSPHHNQLQLSTVAMETLAWIAKKRKGDNLQYMDLRI